MWLGVLTTYPCVLPVTTDQSLVVGHAPLRGKFLFCRCHQHYRLAQLFDQLTSSTLFCITKRTLSSCTQWAAQLTPRPLMIAITKPGEQRCHIPYLLALPLLLLPLLPVLLLSAVLFANTDYVCLHASVHELCPNKAVPHTRTLTDTHTPVAAAAGLSF